MNENRWISRARDLIGLELLERIAAGDDVALLPVGSTELHGPQLPLGTDSFIAEAVCELAAAPLRATVFDPIGYSWPGMTRYSRPTISLSMEVEYTIVRAVVEQLYRIGFRRIAIVQFHGPGIVMTRLAREFFEETGCPAAFYGLMRMPASGRELCAERGMAWEASLCAAAVKQLGVHPHFVTRPVPADRALPLRGGAARERLLAAGAVVGALGSDDLHHGVFHEPVSTELGERILNGLAADIVGSMPALGELEQAWRGVDLEHSWRSRHREDN